MRHLLASLLLLISAIWSFQSSAICLGDFCGGGTQVPVPSTPQNVSVPKSSTSGSYTLTWSSSYLMQTLSRYRIEETNQTTGYRSIAAVDKNTLSYAFSGKADGTYTYRVKACNVDAKYGTEKCSAWGYSSSIVINSVPSTPSTPTGPTTSETGAYTIGWSKPSGTVTYYSLQERANSGSWSVINSSTTSLSQNLSGKGNGTYDYRVRACNSGGCSGYSNYFRVTVQLDGANIIPDAPLVSPSVPANQAVGALEGQAGVSGGAATYSVPIAIPPGRAGMQPSVALTYSSRAGNGIAGVGWSLSAGSSIHRCGQTAAQDVFGFGVTYNASTDRLCLDGKRLIVDGSSYGVSGAVYRTELDSFVKVVQSGNINGSTTSFKVYHKDGRISYYGTAADARHNASGRSEILTWALKKEEDRAANQNNIYYNYTNFGSGEHLLTSIDYTGSVSGPGDRHIVFSYGDGSGYASGERSDASSSYLAGGLSARTKLLESITTQYVDSPIRKYRLNYQTSTTSVRKVIHSIQECGYDENRSESCLPATNYSTFTPSLGWASVNSGDADQSPIANLGTLENNDKILLKDLNGDGVSEALYLDEIKDGSVNDGTYDVRVYTINNQGQYVEETTANLGGYDYLVYGGIEGDINGDGITDFVTSDNRRLVYLQFDNDFKLNRYVTNFYFTAGYDKISGGQGLQIVDVDADGYQDILFSTLGINSTYKITYYRNKANGTVDFTGPHDLEDLGLGQGSTPPVSAIDLDGDGLIDFSRLLLSGQSTRVEKIYFSQRGANGVLSLTSVSSATLGLDGTAEKAIYADLNGDGLKDYVFAKEVSAGVRKWHVQINKGNRSFAAAYSLNTDVGLADMYAYPAGTPELKKIDKNGRVTVADLDGDGAEELVIATHTTDSFTMRMLGQRLTHEGNFQDTMSMCVSDEYLYVEETTTLSCDGVGQGDEMTINLSQYDFRRFYWSIVDFKSDSGSLTHDRTIADIAYAPINGFKFLNGTAFSPLSFKDYNNDGNLDISFVTVGAFSTPGNNGEIFEQGYRVRGSFGGSFNGTNKPVDGMFFQKNSMAHAAYRPDFMFKAVDGLLKEAQWDFAPISRPELVNGKKLYTVPEDREAWYTSKDTKREHFYFTSSMPVVTNFRQSNGVGGTNETTYRYKEAIYNRTGRGFQGFRTVIVDNADGTRAVTDFHQIFPLAGSIEQLQTCLKDDDVDRCGSSPLSQTNIGYSSVDTTSHGTYWNIAAKTVVTNKELRGRAQVSETTRYVGLSDPGPISSDMSVSSSAIESRYGNIKQSVSKVDTGFGVNETQTLNSFYPPDENNWWINKLKDSAVTSKKVSQVTSDNAVYNSALDNDKTVTTHIEEYHSSRQPTKVRTVASSGETVRVNTEYDDYGLPTSVATTADGVTRSVSSGYSSDGYFVSSVTNIDGTSHIETNPRHGQPDSTRDIDGFVSYFKYDVFGRAEEVSPPLGTGQPVYTRYALCQGGCDGVSDPNVAYKVTTYSAGTPETSVYKDQLNRVLYSRSKAFNGADVYTNVTYDNLGRKHFESTPSGNVSGAFGTNYTNYDAIGRLTRKTTSQTDGQFLEVEYYFGSDAGSELAPHRTKITVNNSQTMYRTYNGAGQLMRTTDAQNGITRYAYDGAGNPIVLQDANSHSITATYNALSQKLWVIDPNMGRKDFTYTGFGEVYSEKDAKQDTYYYAYDALGRLTHRYLNGTTSSYLEAEFSYHGNNASCRGVPNQESRNDLSSGESYLRTYQYDNYCRPSGAVTNIDGDSFTSKVFYDGNYGRVKGKQYPSDLIVAYEFNSYGYQSRTKNAQTNAIYRTITSMDHWGNWTNASLGSYINIEREFHVQTGQMKNSILKRYSAQQQSVIYTGYDSFGNLKGQTMGNYDGSTYRLDTENYAYDSLQRLTRSTLTLSGSTQPSVDYGYDKVGNFKYKTDFSMNTSSAYAVGNAAKSAGGNAGPNAVRQVYMKNGSYRNYTYDNNGNLESDGTRNILYNAFNKPTQITIGQNVRIHPGDSTLNPGGTINFRYGADQMRYKQIKTMSGTTTTTIYIGKQYERVTTNGQVTHKSYVDDIAVVSKQEGASTEEVTYFHRDRLGSMIASVSASGYIIKGHSYDPFGKPRDQRMRDNWHSPVNWNVLDDPKTNRGFH